MEDESSSTASPPPPSIVVLSTRVALVALVVVALVVVVGWTREDAADDQDGGVRSLHGPAAVDLGVRRASGGRVAGPGGQGRGSVRAVALVARAGAAVSDRRGAGVAVGGRGDGAGGSPDRAPDGGATTIDPAAPSARTVVLVINVVVLVVLVVNVVVTTIRSRRELVRPRRGGDQPHHSQPVLAPLRRRPVSGARAGAGGCAADRVSDQGGVCRRAAPARASVTAGDGLLASVFVAPPRRGPASVPRRAAPALSSVQPLPSPSPVVVVVVVVVSRSVLAAAS